MCVEVLSRAIPRHYQRSVKLESSLHSTFCSWWKFSKHRDCDIRQLERMYLNSSHVDPIVRIASNFVICRWYRRSISQILLMVLKAGGAICHSVQDLSRRIRLNGHWLVLLSTFTFFSPISLAFFFHPCHGWFCFVFSSFYRNFWSDCAPASHLV